MRVNTDAVRAICCKHWGKWPAEYNAARLRGEISFQAVVAACRLEMLASPLAASEFIEWILPGYKEAQRKMEHQKANDGMLAFIKRQKAKNNGR